MDNRAAYEEAIRNLNEAAYAAVRAGVDTVALPNIDRQSLRLICSETDRLVDQGISSGIYLPKIEAARNEDG